MSWIKTASGRRIDFLRPDPNQITLHDIGTSMSRVARFGGHSPLKIAQHDCEVASLMMMRADENGMSEVQIAEAGIVGFAHDMPEYAVCDVMTPLKRLIGPLYDPIEARILAAVLERFQIADLYANPAYADMLAWADKQAVVEEALRFDLDGKWLSEVTGEWEDCDYDWVNPDTPRFLNDGIWGDEDDTYFALIGSFLRLMVVAGRGDTLSDAVVGLPRGEADVESLRTFSIPETMSVLRQERQFI